MNILTPIPSIEENIFKAVRDIVENFKMITNFRSASIKVADNAFVVATWNEKKKTSHIKLEYFNSRSDMLEYYHICDADKCAYSKPDMMSIINKIMKQKYIKGDENNKPKRCI